MNPMTTTTVWNFKGSELQGSSVGQAVTVGDEHLIMACTSKPVMHMISFQSRGRKHVRFPVPGTVSALAVSPDGKICCVGIHEKIYTWLTTTGELLTILTGHYQTITKLKFNDNGWILVSTGKDGVIQVWNYADLLRPHDPGVDKPEPLRRWPAHSLGITGLHVTNGGLDARICTSSSDQTIKLHSLASDRCLLTVILDCMITSCVMDPTETRIFVGTVKGIICQINLFTEPINREMHVSTLGTGGDSPLFIGHGGSVKSLALNLDGTILASGDNAEFRIWDIVSKQSLKTIPVKGPVTTLEFIPPWKSVTDPDFQGNGKLLITSLQRQLSAKSNGLVSIDVEHDTNCEVFHIVNDIISGEVVTDEDIENEMDAFGQKNTTVLLTTPVTPTLAPQEPRRDAELRKLKHTNKELYEFMVDKILDCNNDSMMD